MNTIRKGSKMLSDEIMAVKKEVKQLKEQSLAMELIRDYKKANQRMFVIIIAILIMWFLTIGYLVYTLNDIGYEEVTTETETYDIDQDSGDNGNNNFINGDSNEVNNG